MQALSCVLVGDAAVTLRCAEILLGRGHCILGLVTGDGRVAGWAAERGIRCRFEPPERPLGRDHVADLTGGLPFEVSAEGCRSPRSSAPPLWPRWLTRSGPWPWSVPP